MRDYIGCVMMASVKLREQIGGNSNEWILHTQHKEWKKKQDEDEKRKKKL